MTSYTLKTPAKLAAELVANPFGQPGQTHRFACTTTGGALCATCCRKKARKIAKAKPDGPWYISRLDSNLYDAALVCSSCRKTIPHSL